MRHVESKQEFYRLSRKLLLGNILRQWTWEEFVSQFVRDRHALSHGGTAVLPKVVGVRHVRKAFTNKGSSGLLPVGEAYLYGDKTPDKHNLLFDEGAIHDHLTIQGEVMADERGLCVRYSHLQCHQRTLWHIAHYGLKGLKPYQLPHNQHILSKEEKAGRANTVVKYARGLKATHLLQRYMDGGSWEILNDILSCQHGGGNTFDDDVRNFAHPVVEFACFDRPVGVLRFNTLIWEVRTKY